MSRESCPRCKGSMEEGLVVDETHHNRAAQPHWVPGPVAHGFWGLKLSGKRRHPVTTWRCTQCGYLQSFAAVAARK